MTAAAPALAPLARAVRLDYLHGFDAPADAVYALLADFGGSRLTDGYVAHVEAIGSGVGMQRVFHLDPRVGAGSVIEELTLLDPARRAIGFRMVDNGPLPWSQYQGYAEVTPRNRSACTLYAWTSFVVDEAAVAQFTTISRQNYAHFFGNIERALRRN